MSRKKTYAFLHISSSPLDLVRSSFQRFPCFCFCFSLFLCSPSCSFIKKNKYKNYFTSLLIYLIKSIPVYYIIDKYYIGGFNPLQPWSYSVQIFCWAWLLVLDLRHSCWQNNLNSKLSSVSHSPHLLIETDWLSTSVSKVKNCQSQCLCQHGWEVLTVLRIMESWTSTFSW